jgi:hypothetical protein
MPHEIGSKEFVAQVVRASSSVFVLGIVEVLLKTGIATIEGMGPNDEEEKRLWVDAGNKPYSIRLGGGPAISFVYTPWALSLAARANYENWLKYRKGGEKDGMTRWLAAAAFAPAVILDLPMMDGVSDLLDTLVQMKRGNINAVPKFAGSKVGMAFPNMLRYIDRLFDPTKYTTEGVQGLIIDQMPFARRSGTQLVNVFGEPVGEGKAMIERFAGRFFSFPIPSDAATILAKFNPKITVDKPGEAYTVQNKERVPMTKEQYEAFTIGIGKEFKEYVLKRFDPKATYDVDAIESNRKAIENKHQQLRDRWRRKVASK